MGDNNSTKTTAALQLEVTKRKAWFFECQLRRLTLEHFRDVEVNEESPDPLLNVISEPLLTAGFPAGQIGSRMKALGYVYLDSKQPVWTRDERDQRNKFAGTFIGRTANWLDYRIPVKLAENLAQLKMLYEASISSSTIDDLQVLNHLGREAPTINIDWPKDQDRLSHAISRVAITESKPWLIPEIFNGRNPDVTDVKKWVENGETFISNYEFELNEVLGGNKNPAVQFSLAEPEAYRTWIKSVLKDSLTVNSSAAVKVQFLDTSSEPWRFNIKIQTPGYPALNELKGYSSSDGVKYWINTCQNALEEVFINKADSDMGLCLIMRALYLYGALPATLGGGQKLRWRDRKPPPPSFHHFFAKRAKLIDDDPELHDRLSAVQTKLQILLEETAASPHSGAIHFSPLAQEIIKQDILGYKFWIDEPFQAINNNGNPGDENQLSDFNKARKDIGEARKAVGKEATNPFSEMEYWSENHYIMFASSEYLAGQLWETETFQPARDFLKPKAELTPRLLFADTSATHTGKERMDRGKARTLKWLNNRLMFGWTEFNSSGYYREHLMALLNLVDFSLDEEVQTKAALVTDLLLFDLIRFSHKGSMGAAGGRSQFKSKCAGWDNALGDVVEIILGSRGIFLDSGGDIGCSFSTSTYKVPDVLLEIGNHPPASFVDRSRVSLTFEEASKYGIQYSKKSDQKTSIERGFSSKRATHYAFLKSVNDEIARTHPGYGAMEDDTVFWWTTSAYFNKEVVKNTFELIERLGLRETGVFKELFILVKIILPLIEKTSHGFLGAAIGSLTGAGAATLAGAVIGFVFDDIFDYSIIEEGTNDFSRFLEGSTRTRANILTYRNRDVMLSSVQNFRVGQFNFQSNVNQATLNTSINVFTTGAFAGIDLSSFETGLLGAVLGGAATGAVGGAIMGGAIGAWSNVMGEAATRKKPPLATHGDGPGWWTGYWALPMVVQHETAAILAYDFSGLQKKLARAGSHLWFPTNGIKETENRRSSSLEDDNFALLDIGDIGPEGFWLFGKIVHKNNFMDPAASEEAYIGVFSNQRPKLLDQDSDFYEAQLEIEGIPPADLFSDYFADKDRYVSGKNIWIIQVGNKDEFSDYDNFKDRVSKAKIVLDDVGDMECSYAIPRKEGASQILSLKYGDGGAFSLNGKPFDTDFYPRFENPFVRGGLVEWGQREYVIAHNGKYLLHDFSDMALPVRTEIETRNPTGATTLKGLVIYLRTGDEEMRIFTVATATVNIGCEAVAVDEVIAAGAVDTNTTHDVEWIFFDKPMLLTPYMTIEIKHPPSSDGDDDPEWKMSFSLRALMGDRRVYDCSVSFSGCHFEDERRSTGYIPFTVQISKWQTWQMLDDGRFDFWQIASQPGWEFYYYSYSDLFAIDSNRRLWHRRLEACAGPNSEWKAVSTTGQSLLFDKSPSICSISTQPDNLFVFAMNKGKLFNCSSLAGEDMSDKKWSEVKVETLPTIFGLTIPDAAPVPVPLSSQTQIVAKVLPNWQLGVGLYLSAADNDFYSRAAWVPGDSGPWRKISTDSVFKPLAGQPFEVCGGHLFVLDDRRQLWAGALNGSDVNITPSWKQLSDDQTTVNNFCIAYKKEIFTLLINANQGEIRAGAFSSTETPVTWERVGAAENFMAFPKAKLACAVAGEGRLDIFTTGVDGKISTMYWNAQQGWDQGNTWKVIDDEGHHFEGLEGAPLAVVNRVNNQLEVFTGSHDEQIWKTWWT